MSSVKFVPASGTCKSGLVIVGEAPGAEEDKQGKPFIGRAGKLLDKLLQYIGLNRDDVYVTNIVKIRPVEIESLGYHWEKIKNRTPTDEELLSWKPSLLKEIAEIQPKVILALGACAAKTLLGWQKFANMTTTRGRIFTLKNGIKVIPSWHPAYLLRKSGDKTINKQVKEDLRLVKESLNL